MTTGFTKILSAQFWVQAFQAFLQTFRRFPLVMLSLIFITLLTILKSHSYNLLAALEWQRSMLMGIVGALWFLASGLFSESHQWTRVKRYSLALPAFVLLCWKIVTNDTSAHSTWTMLFAIALAVTFAAYFFRRHDNDSFWYFNFQLIEALCFAFLAALILCGGLSLSLISIDYLFDIKVSRKLYADIWVFGWCFFAPAYFLAQVPTQFDYQRSDCKFPRGVYFIQNYVLIPLSLIYMVILYAYFIKILLQWELPRGNLGLMVCAFGVIGIVTHWMIFPMHDRNKPLLGWFYRNFYKMMVVPLGLLILVYALTNTD
ncbi:MAG: hypothetical protein V3U75_06590 [Methylococcaceae bacterium]